MPEFLRADDIAQAAVGIGFVADEFDNLDARLDAFLDVENQIDAIIWLLDDLRRDRDFVAAKPQQWFPMMR